jgi:hypothetical protein
LIEPRGKNRVGRKAVGVAGKIDEGGLSDLFG